ncbi:hypothetical protein H5410_046960 [Solanum commersonii]|uniref:Uncharacterized protein n=1 Tax=Solanum commersonii TaxID=4109 RepID=A0A9J5XH97_SOLCO|nr:hypothetical protein H5410_046960 [Solanum commersonii]
MSSSRRGFSSQQELVINIGNERRSGGMRGTTYWITPATAKRDAEVDSYAASYALLGPPPPAWWRFRSTS